MSWLISLNKYAIINATRCFNFHGGCFHCKIKTIKFVGECFYPCQVHCDVTVWICGGVLTVHAVIILHFVESACFAHLIDASLFVSSNEILIVSYGGN